MTHRSSLGCRFFSTTTENPIPVTRPGEHISRDAAKPKMEDTAMTPDELLA
ncbi:MAG: hypothetical protein M1274_00810 [Actinobacteria bacterium]|nr:hypothetical protein [Actinomycetota bacterium]